MFYNRTMLITLGWVVGVILWLALALIALLQVPPLPTRKQEMDVAFGLANVQPGELVIDLGAGDGRFLQQAARRYKAVTQGWEIHPIMWLIAKMRLGWGADIRLANLWKADVSRADVVFIFLMARFMGRVEAELWSKMKPGARLVSNTFILPGVVPTQEQDGVYLYVKP